MGVTVRPDPFRERDKVAERANEKAAAELEMRLKPFYDPGLLEPMGTVRVAAEGNRLIVYPTSRKEMVEQYGVEGGTDSSRQGVLGNEHFVDAEMLQVLEFDYPKFLEDSARSVVDEDPNYSFDEEPL